MSWKYVHFLKGKILTTQKPMLYGFLLIGVGGVKERCMQNWTKTATGKRTEHLPRIAPKQFLLLVGCIPTQQYTRVPQEWICSIYYGHDHLCLPKHSWCHISPQLNLKWITYLRSHTCRRRSVPLDAKIVSLWGDHCTCSQNKSCQVTKKWETTDPPTPTAFKQNNVVF